MTISAFEKIVQKFMVFFNVGKIMGQIGYIIVISLNGKGLDIFIIEDQGILQVGFKNIFLGRVIPVIGHSGNTSFLGKLGNRDGRKTLFFQKLTKGSCNTLPR